MSDVIKINDLVKNIEVLKNEISKVIIGQHNAVNHVLLSVLCGGHSLLIGVPGLAKTLLVNTVAKALGLDFKRIQFTPDLMPSDILGSEILDENRHFKFIKGPIFSNIILADEINRTTQNPIEQEGTYPLPEAQLDRFMFSIYMDYPSFEEEILVAKKTTSDEIIVVNSVFSSQDIIEYQHLIRRIPIADNVVEYAVRLATKTRPNENSAPDIVKNYIDWGAGPRASQNLVLAAKAYGAINGKYSPDIEDVQAVASGILHHRIVKNYKAEAEGITESQIIKSLF